MNQLDLNLLAFGRTAETLTRLHLEEPENFTAEYVLERLISEYQEMKEDETDA